jgi:hypothetical protein
LIDIADRIHMGQCARKDKRTNYEVVMTVHVAAAASAAEDFIAKDAYSAKAWYSRLVRAEIETGMPGQHAFQYGTACAPTHLLARQKDFRGGQRRT